ncbi:hypothetical protein [Halomonas elongata]|uniref:Alanyl-tRNA synthetase n=1 Tax=Halomonas elongata TaxID=2746 RepID=A0A1B8P6W3_HALEL|nr:hypothetical protein [Halomonas elongata]OBX38024.1 alanyl-tRNA synthetase [Halomonas elongata]
MSERLYLAEEVLTCAVEIIDCRPCDNERFAVRMLSTPFHPQGGGQPSDTGWIGEAEVLHVESTAEGDVLHYTDVAVPVGIAQARVDQEQRRLHSMLHSAGHLIGHVMEQRGWAPSKAHHWPGEARVVFKPEAQAQQPTSDSIQAACAQLIAADLPLRITVDESGTRKVGFGELAPYPCGGTHVHSLGKIPGIDIQGMKMKKGSLIIRYDISSQ